MPSEIIQYHFPLTKNECKNNVELIKNNLFSFSHKFKQHCVE